MFSSIIALLLSYLLGSVNFGFVFAKLIQGIDIRQHGSGNAGATNTLRVLGLGPAIVVLGLDALKGIAAVLIGSYFQNDPYWLPVLCGAAAVAGHNWPVYFKFHGGKGIATTIGVMAMLAFFPTLYAAIVAVIVIAVTRYVSLGSLVFTFFLPIFTFFLDKEWPVCIAALVLFLLAAYRHQGNIKKLIAGTEAKIGK